MEEGQFQRIQGWFETLNGKMESLVTKQQFENRFQALFAAISNLHDRVESYRDQTNSEIILIKRALHDMDHQVQDLQRRPSGS